MTTTEATYGPITEAELVLSEVETRLLAIRAVQRAGWYHEFPLSTSVLAALFTDVCMAAEQALTTR